MGNSRNFWVAYLYFSLATVDTGRGTGGSGREDKRTEGKGASERGDEQMSRRGEEGATGDERTKKRGQTDERQGGRETMGTRDELKRDEEGVRRVILAL